MVNACGYVLAEWWVVPEYVVPFSVLMSVGDGGFIV